MVFLAIEEASRNAVSGVDLLFSRQNSSKLFPEVEEKHMIRFG